MDKEIMMEVAPHVIQVCAPLAGAAANHHYTKKEMEMKKELEVEKAERTAQGLQQLGGGPQQPAQQPQQAGGQPAQPQQPTQQSGDVYERLRDLRAQTDCGFCQEAIEGLLDADRQTAQQGERELRQYLDRAEQLRAANASEDKVSQEMGQLTDEWDVIPDVMMGAV